MEVGQVDSQQLSSIDFHLPDDPAATIEVLRNSDRVGNTKFYVGCGKWGRKDWVGRVYPPGTKEKDFFQQYAMQFNCIEFNAIAYTLPSKEQVRKWKSKLDNGFLVCPKFTQLITHIKRLNVERRELDAFFETMQEFGDNLGPLFLLPHPQMGPRHLDIIETFLRNLPANTEVFLELRHEEWFKENGLHNVLYSYLRNNSKGIVITDAAGRRDLVHMHLSTPDCFIRFFGNDLDRTDFVRIDQWVARLQQWQTAGLRNCYFMLHQQNEVNTPELAAYVIDQLNHYCDAGIKQLPMGAN